MPRTQLAGSPTSLRRALAAAVVFGVLFFLITWATGTPVGTSALSAVLAAVVFGVVIACVGGLRRRRRPAGADSDEPHPRTER